MSEVRPAMSRVLVHVDGNEEVWLGDDVDAAVPTRLRASELWRSPHADRLREASRWRIRGGHDAVGMIAGLWRFSLRLAGPTRKIEVATPTCFGLSQDPRNSLAELQHVETASLLPLSSRSYVGYALSEAAKEGGDSSIVDRLLVEHPAYDALTFVPGCDLQAGREMLADIVEPRWYRHPLRPERFSRLFRKLGLTPEAAREFVRNRRRDGTPPAFRAWCNENAIPERSGEDPRSFLWRVYFSKTGGRAKAVCETAKHFVRFVVAGWLADVTGARENGYFSRSAEERAFREHVRTRKDRTS